MKRRILAVTGIRSEYDILYPVINALREDQRFDVSLAVSGAHLSDWHGGTVEKIREDGFRIADTIDSLFMTNRDTQRAKGAGVLTYALSQTVERERPDMLLVVGDREESIATAVVGTYMNTLVAHIGGGDTVFGNADDPVRFAVSRLAHIHLVTSDRSGKNLIAAGEEEFRVFFAGTPGLDNIRLTPQVSPEEISRRLSFDITDGKYLVLINHPLSSEREDACAQMTAVLAALEGFCSETGYKVVASYPNTDPGAYDILRAVDAFSGKAFIRFYKTLPRETFVNVMRRARCLAGNSSMGILEAPFYGLPVVNVGNRQQGRMQAGNVVFTGYDSAAITNELRRACFDEEYRKKVRGLANPFGDGHSGEKIRDILAAIDPADNRWRIKKFK